MVRSCFDILAELFARDVDKALLARSLKKTPTERIEWLEQMQAFADEAKASLQKAKSLEAQRTPRAPR